MIELLHTVTTTLASTAAVGTEIVTSGSSIFGDSSSSTTTPFTSFIGGNDLFNGSTNVSNHIRQVLFASSANPNSSLDTTPVDLANDTIFGRNETVVREFIFDRTDVRIIFITLYSLVFFCCFFGK